MIQVFLVQHGIAEPSEVNPNRPLSNEGRRQLERVVRHLKSKGIVINKVAHSGKLRAAQSAEIFADFLNVDQIVMQPGMNPNDDCNELIQQLVEDRVMYIGHLPHLDRVVAQLFHAAPATSVLQFQNAAVACLQLERDKAMLAWYLTPALC